MRETIPQVYLIAEPKLNWEAVYRYLQQVPGATVWQDRVQEEPFSDAEKLVEIGGRLCYRSWAPSLNANVSKVREDSAEYLLNILRSGHGSVLEHANFSFVFHDVSRVFTHELVRHRAGVAISQESLRYVRLTDLGVRIPSILEPLRKPIVTLVESLETFQREAADLFDLDAAGTPFSVKKEVTSALRRLAPIGLSTGMLWTANIRTIRHVMSMRTAPFAEEEIRIVFDEVARLMVETCPLLFGDYTREDDGTWTTPYPKV